MLRASNAAIAGGWSPHASAMVRTAPFITRTRCPFCSTTASVRRLFASNGAKETGVAAGKPPKMCRSFAAARNARSIGSWLASCRRWNSDYRTAVHHSVNPGASHERPALRSDQISCPAARFDPIFLWALLMESQLETPVLSKNSIVLGFEEGSAFRPRGSLPVSAPVRLQRQRATTNVSGREKTNGATVHVL
jgi:hypothetical protein